MGWSHPFVSLEDLMDRIKVFVDILVLASGYQSSGLPANWDVENIKKAVRWGLFFEDVMKSLWRSGNYADSMMELDAALYKLTSDPKFPLGLAHLSAETLCNGTKIILEHLLQIHPLKDEHLVSFLRAAVEMNLDEFTKLNDYSPRAYNNELTLHLDSVDPVHAKRGLAEEVNTLRSANDPSSFDCFKNGDQNLRSRIKFNSDSRENIAVERSCFIQEILDRQSVMSYISSIEKGLDVISKFITSNSLMELKVIQWEHEFADEISSEGDQILTQLYQFSHWRSMCLSYLLDKRTIKLLSGAELIFKAPHEQWVRIFEGLKTSTDACDDNMLEVVEILLLRLISGKWNYLIQQVVSLPCDFLRISNKLSDLHELLQPNSLVLHVNKENDMLEYLTSLLRFQPKILWKLPSVLVAAAIPSWSILFSMHLSEAENQYNKQSSARLCDCNKHGNGHQIDCLVTEVIQCLHTFHIQCSPAGD